MTNVSNSSGTKTRYMVLIGLMTAVICILAPFSLVLPFSPVPVSLSTLVISLAVMVLGMKNGFISVLLYVLLGLAGLPVFSGFTGGAGKLLGPTGGYILGYLFLALICGFFVDKWSGKSFPCFVGMILGVLVCYGFGTLWLAYQAGISLSAAFVSAVLPFLPADLIKIVIALWGGKELRKRLVKAGLL